MTPEIAADSPWPAVWNQALEIVAQRRAARRGERRPEGPLTWSPNGGWQLSADCEGVVAALFSLYKPLLDHAPTDPPWVVAHLGQSLDGCVATHCGDSNFVTGPDNLVHLHRLRALADAVMVGAGTVAADDPQLTTRRVPGRHATRVVVDPTLRLAPRAQVFCDGQAPTLWLCNAEHGAASAVQAPAAERVDVPGLLDAAGELDGAVLIEALAARGLRLLFVEGGGVTVSRLLLQGCLDRLHLAIAPVLIGSGRPGLRLPGFDRMDDCLRPPARIVPMGEDVLWDLDLRAGAARRG